MKILVRAPYRGDSGYAVVNRNIIISLARSGHELYFEPVVWASNTCPVTQEEEVFLAWAERNGYMNIPPDDNILTLNLTIPELYNLKMRGKNVGWYIFEADRVPERWKFYIDQMDEIITPTKFNADQLIAMGYKKPIHILHEGINPKIYNPEVEPVFKSDKFTFLFVGIAHERKRWKEVISCFFETFKTQEDVRLILKLQPTPHATAGEIEKHIQDEKNRTGSVAEIKLCTRPIDGSLASIYTSTDCFVSIAAEGFCLPAIESIACGCYSILLDWGGFTEWHTEAMGLKVAVKDIRTCENMQGFSGYEDSSLKWAYPDLEDFKNNMFEAYENRVHIKNTRKERSSLIHAQYNWQKTVKEGLIPLLEEKKPIIAAQKPKLSVAMITKNVSGFTVDGCNVFKSNLSILSKLADEIIVVDGNSTDDTVSVAENFGAKVYQYNDCKQKCGICGVQTPEDVCDPETREQKDCFSKFRKASFRLCTGDWIMRLDSEELIREEDIETFRNLILNADKDFYKYIAFIFPTVNFWKQVPYYRAGWDGTFSWFPDNHVRLYKNIPELHNFFAPAHEGVNVPTDAGWVNLINHKQTLYLSNPVVFHYGYLKQDSIDRNSRYEKLGASTHYLGNENYYGLSTVKWESNVPELKYSEKQESSEGGAKRQ
jgi:glycosyltransferase involved in cell wall biosynthesis